MVDTSCLVFNGVYIYSKELIKMDTLLSFDRVNKFSNYFNRESLFLPHDLLFPIHVASSTTPHFNKFHQTFDKFCHITLYKFTTPYLLYD